MHVSGLRLFTNVFIFPNVFQLLAVLESSEYSLFVCGEDGAEFGHQVPE